MAITKSAKKRIKSSEKKRIFNMRTTRAMRDAIKKFSKAVTAGDTKVAQDMVPTLYKTIDKAAKKGIIKKNNAARKKSRLSKKLASLSK